MTRHMRNDLLFAKFKILFLFLTCTPVFVLSQVNHEVGIYSCLFEEFSFDKRIQKTLVPLLADIGRYQSSTNPDQFWRARPISIGMYYRRLSQKQYSISFSGHYYRGGAISIGVAGASSHNEHGLFGVEIGRPLKTFLNNRLSIIGVTRATFRIGKDTYSMNYNNVWMDLRPYRRLIDLAGSVGINARYQTPFRVSIFVEAAYTRWLFLYSNIFNRTDLNNGYYPLKPWNQVEMRFGLGYNFKT